MTNNSEALKHAKKIAALNDALRMHGTGGRIMLTSGIQALGQAAVNEILNKIRTFNAFTRDNDPHHEHDFASITVGRDKIFFKIDYYDTNLQYASPDPADASKTCRVMTILLADEYYGFIFRSKQPPFRLAGSII